MEGFGERKHIRCIRVLVTEHGHDCERCFFGSRFSVALLSSLADSATKIHFGHEKPEHANAPNVMN